MSIYQDILESIKNDIQNGSLEKGSKLPSIRQLSQTYSCSKDTAQRALLELRYQNYIYAVPKVATMFLRDAPIQVTKSFSILMTIIS